MKPYLLYSPSDKELTLISAVMDFLLKKRGTIQIPESVQKLDRLKVRLEEAELLKLLVCDVTTEGVIPLLEQTRQRNSGMKLVLVADGTVPPVQYIRPSVLPTALLWRPMQPETVRDTLWDVLQTIPTDSQESAETDSEVFLVEVRGSVSRIPYQDILFFEACNKRLNLHLRRKEIPFSGTLEKLAEELPEEFLRIHKSFIVNRKAITQILFSQNLVLLEDGISVPISRSYKPMLKAVFT